jgi:hypothetical protein
MPRDFSKSPGYSFVRVPTRNLSSLKNNPSLPPANRMYLSVYSGVPTPVFLYAYLDMKIGTVPKSSRYRSIKPPLTRCSGRPFARCWGRGGSMSNKYLFLPPKKSFRYWYETTQDSYVKVVTQVSMSFLKSITIFKE